MSHDTSSPWRIFALAAGILAACFVQGRSYRSQDDETRTCTRDDDCDFDEQCLDQRCRAAPGCAACGQVPHGRATCFHGLCLVEVCETGWQDANGIYQDGCEYACVPRGAEVCNHEDDDCDGLTDEDFDLFHDPDNCGECGRSCPYPPNAEPICAGARCYFQCLPGHYDVDGDPDNGCESTTCEPTGEEVCDLRDNDCDGKVDEGIPKDTIASCGPLCETCSFEHAMARCHEGRCELVACLPGFYDIDHDPSNGCEYACEPTGPEVCDGADNDCNGLTDEGLVCRCPEGMVNILDQFCIDKYEASRPDATASSPGTDNSYATSRPGVMPWMGVSFEDAQAACEAAGKRLCTPSEWELACRGPDDTEYSYGDTYDPTACNGIDAFCYCDSSSQCGDQDPCPFPHCYGTCGAAFHPVPTGSFPSCTNGFGVYDINGNVWERVSDGAGRGGAFNCLDSEALHKCSYVADWGLGARSNFGFRCCCTDCPE